MRKLILASAIFFAGTASAATLSFQEAYDGVLSRSLKIETSRLEVEIARENHLRQIGTFLPSVSASASETRQGEPAFGPTRSAALTANANLFRSGADVNGVRATSKDISSREQRLESARLTAEQDAVSAIFDVIARSKETRIVAEIVKLKEESLRIARERYAKGLLPNQEVDKVSIELENSRARFVDAQSSEASARAVLRAALGRDDVAIDWPWRETIIHGVKLDERAFDLGLRPDYRALNLALEAEGLRRHQTLASGFLPSLDLTASYGNADLSQNARRDWSAVLTLSLPLFDGFKNWSSYRIQSLTEQASRLELEAVKRSAPAENEALRLEFRVARDSALARERTSQITQRLFADGFQRFRLGRASVNDLALDQNRLFESQLLEIQGWQNAHVSLAKLCHSHGRRIGPLATCD